MLAKKCLDAGGGIYPLIIPSDLTNGTGLMNPSIMVDNDEKIKVILRHVNYTFYHSEKKLFQHQWGPLTYVHPENDMHLRTINYYLEINSDNFTINRYFKVDTTKFDTYEPIWDFVGLEDARIIRWDDKLYITGVRRDVATDGQGRMEISEIEVEESGVKEVSRLRIPPPRDLTTYCEKNWMPIVDKPWHYVKWCNPTEIVRVDPIKKTSYTAFTGNQFNAPNDFRGGSQVIAYKSFYIAFIHQVDLFQSDVGRKDGKYRHRLVIWDKDWNIVKYTKEFSILDGDVEFVTGLARYKNDFLLTFGFQDNAAFILKMPEAIMEELINENS
jgi:predicted GH43/DUF377 family glycosyl hydrolase